MPSHAACVYGVIPAILNERFQVAIPCRGDHYNAIAGHEEMIFADPREKLEDPIAGLRYVEKRDSRIPRGYNVEKKCQQSDPCEEIANMMGVR